MNAPDDREPKQSGSRYSDDRRDPAGRSEKGQLVNVNGESLPPRLLVADDHDLIRQGMRILLASEPDLEVVGEAADGCEAIELCRSLSPDLVLMDVGMPKMDGLEATRRIKAESPEIAVLIVTAHADLDYLLEAMRAGAAGYVLKGATQQQVVEAIRRVLAGEFPLNQEFAVQLLRRLAKDRSQRTEPPPPPEPTRKRQARLSGSLTAREIDVLRLVTAGKTNRQIAGELYLALSTVKGYLERIIAKLEVSDRTQAVVRAIELGLLPNQVEEEKK